MARITTSQQNFSGGELSPQLNGRLDLGIYYNGASWLQNFIATVQGMARFRSGSKFVWNTRGNQEAILVPFEFNTEQAYILEFTDQKMRIIKDGALTVDTAQDITGITQADPGVLTYDGADSFANGDAVVIQDVVGMVELNNQEFRVANVNTTNNTFELTDQDGNNVDTSAFTAYSSGGTVAKIIEVTTPYTEAQLFNIDFGQTADTMYLVHPSHAPRKLTRSSHTAWTLATYTITGNPFGTTKAAAKTITGATKANPCEITATGHSYSTGDVVHIDGIVGMTELNKRDYTITSTGANTFTLDEVDSTAYTTYSSGGTAEKYTAFSYPSVVAFFERRLLFAATDSKPQTIFFSRGGDYDIFNTGTEADDGVIYTIASGRVNRIRWMVGTEEFLAIGTAGGEFKAQGGGENDAITPTNVSIKPPSFYGSADVKPIQLDSHILYIQRDSVTSRTFEFDAIQDGYTSINRNLTADQILQGRYGKSSGAKQIAYQSGSPNISWMVRKDGILVGLTFEPREQVNGWHRHIAGGSLTGGKLSKPEYESVAAIPQAEKADQVYTVVKRTVNGATVRYIEYFADQPNIPQFLDYYTGDKDADTDNYLQDLWEAQKRLFYVDSGLEFDGSVAQAGTLSAATVGTGRTFTAGGATFASGDVGREIWGKEGGRAVITAYTSSTEVTVKVTVAFPTVSIASGDWYLTTDEFGGLQHLEGQSVIVLADGGVIEGKTVTDGKITTTNQHSYVIVGLSYTGIFKSMDLEAPGNNGAGVTKQKSMSQIGVKLLDTLGAKFGTDIYKLDKPPYRSTADKTSRPPPLHNGVIIVNVNDSWTAEKYVYCVQERPLPCNLQLYAPYITVNDG